MILYRRQGIMRKMTVLLAVFLSLLLVIPVYISQEVNPFDENTEDVEDDCIVSLNLPTDPVLMTSWELPDDWPAAFKIGLDGIYGDFDVMNKTYPGWCVEYGVSAPEDILEVNLVSSYDESLPPYLADENWSKVNYILNHKQGNRYDVQRAIWYFVNFGSWDYDYTGYPPMGDSVSDNVTKMIENASLYADSWCPDPCEDVVAVICDQGEDRIKQLSFIEVPLSWYEFKGETAWAANGEESGKIRYTPRGNWATYVEYDGEQKEVTLFAGQTINVGTVHFSDPVDETVTITITLTGDWEFDEVEENVKIQDYETAPSGNPSIGLFDHKGDATGSSFSIDVTENNYYGVHVDVGYWEEGDCED